MALQAAEDLADRFRGFGAELEDAAAEDVYEAEALTTYLCRCRYSWGPTVERCLFTFLVLLRISVDKNIPASEQLRDFARSLFNSSGVFSGVDEEEDIWQPLEELWRKFNQGKVCPCSSSLRWQTVMCCPHKPARTPAPFIFEECKDGPRQCSRCSGAKCRSEASPRQSLEIKLGNWLATIEVDSDTSSVCTCEPQKGSSSNACRNIFDLVDRLVQEDYFLNLPVHNMGWNLRRVVVEQNVEQGERLIFDAYSKARLSRPHYEDMESMTMNPFRVREARCLIRGLEHSPFLRKLVLETPPLLTLPLHYHLSDAATHARLWLLRCDLPVHYNHTLTYAEVCTKAELQQKDACEVFLEERGPSMLEHCLRQFTLLYYWRAPAMHGLTDIRVLNMRPQDYEEGRQRKPKDVDEVHWKALIKLAHPAQVAGHMYLVDPVREVCIHLDDLRYETKNKKRWLFAHTASRFGLDKAGSGGSHPKQSQMPTGAPSSPSCSACRQAPPASAPSYNQRASPRSSSSSTPTPSCPACKPPAQQPDWRRSVSPCRACPNCKPAQQAETRRSVSPLRSCPNCKPQRRSTSPPPSCPNCKRVPLDPCAPGSSSPPPPSCTACKSTQPVRRRSTSPPPSCPNCRRLQSGPGSSSPHQPSSNRWAASGSGSQPPSPCPTCKLQQQPQQQPLRCTACSLSMPPTCKSRQPAPAWAPSCSSGLWAPVLGGRSPCNGWAPPVASPQSQPPAGPSSHLMQSQPPAAGLMPPAGASSHLMQSSHCPAGPSSHCPAGPRSLVIQSPSPSSHAMPSPSPACPSSHMMQSSPGPAQYHAVVQHSQKTPGGPYVSAGWMQWTSPVCEPNRLSQEWRREMKRPTVDMSFPTESSASRTRESESSPSRRSWSVESWRFPELSLSPSTTRHTSSPRRARTQER